MLLFVNYPGGGMSSYLLAVKVKNNIIYVFVKKTQNED